MNLLLIEGDVSMRATLERTLAGRGMRITSCVDDGQALPTWRTLRPDVVLLAVGSPGGDGLDVLVKAREQGLRAPVMVLTERCTAGDRVAGLNAGADDYVSQPFNLEELEARVRALARRAPAAAGGPLGNLRLDAQSGAFYSAGELLDLTPRESALLRALAARPERAVAKDTLFAAVFPGELDVQYEAVEVVVYRLRKKLARTGVALVTARGLGYLLKAQ